MIFDQDQDLGALIGQLNQNLNARTINQLENALDGQNAFFQKKSMFAGKKKKVQSQGSSDKKNGEPAKKQVLIRKTIMVDKFGFEVTEKSQNLNNTLDAVRKNSNRQLSNKRIANNFSISP